MLEHGLSQHEGSIFEPTHVLTFWCRGGEEEILWVLHETVSDPTIDMTRKLSRYDAFVDGVSRLVEWLNG